MLTVSTTAGSHLHYALSQGGTYWSGTVSLTSGEQQLYGLH